MRWRKTQVENVSGDIIRYHSSSITPYGRVTRPQEMINILNERKNLASIYIMCRALIIVVRSIPKDALSDAMGHNLEDMTFGGQDFSPKADFCIVLAYFKRLFGPLYPDFYSTQPSTPVFLLLSRQLWAIFPSSFFSSLRADAGA